MIIYIGHDLVNKPVENRSFEVKGLPRLSDALFSSTKSSEIIGGLWANVVSQDHLDTSSRCSTDGDVEEDLRA